MIKRYAHTCRRIIEKQISRFFYPLDEKAILAALKGMGGCHSRILFVHSSLSRCGYLKEGSQSLLKALQEWSSGETTIAIPTHTYCYPDAAGNVPIFDAKKTRSVVGAISDDFWRLPNVTRSIHPTHSVAALGKEGQNLCQDHEKCDTPCGKGTPYEKLIRADSSVLMFGSTMNTYTLFHTAEDAAKAPYLYEEKPCHLRYRDDSGAIKSLYMRKQNMAVPRRFSEMEDWLFSQKLLTRKKLGRGMLIYIPSAAKVHELLLKELSKNPFFLSAAGAQSCLGKAV